MIDFLDRTSICLYISHPTFHFYQGASEVDTNENFSLVENWIKNDTYNDTISIESLVKIMKNSISRVIGGEGYRLDECEIKDDVHDSFLSFYATSEETRNAFNGADYVFIEFDRFFIGIGR